MNMLRGAAKAKAAIEEKNDAGVIQETKKTDGGGAPKETEEEHQVEVELGSILKRSPSMSS